MSYEIMTESYNFVKCYGKDEIFIEICYYNAVKSTKYHIMSLLEKRADQRARRAGKLQKSGFVSC